MSETTQRMREVHAFLAKARKDGITDLWASAYARDVFYMLSLLDMWGKAKFIKVTKMDHEQQLRDMRFTISNDATMMALVQEAALSCQPHADEYRRRLEMGIELLVQAFGTHAVQMKEMQAELAKLQYQTEQSEPLGRGVDEFHAGQRITAVFHTQEVNEELLTIRRSVIESVEQKCRPSSPSGSAAPCTPCCVASGAPDEEDDDEGLDTPDLETAVLAQPPCHCENPAFHHPDCEWKQWWDNQRPKE